MSRNPTPKLDQIRALRERNYEQAQAAARAAGRPARKSIDKLKAEVAAIQVKKDRAKKKRRM